MAITPALIRELREMTGAGMTDCKKALDATDGNIQQAIVVLREKGLAAAAKKAGRIAAEGLAYTLVSNDEKTGIVVEVNSETDFVAKNQEFRTFVDQIAQQALKSNGNTFDELANDTWDFGDYATVGDAVKGTISRFGENIGVRRFSKLDKTTDGFFQTYIHGEGKVAVLIDIESDSNSDTLKEAARNICMQICVMRPLYVNKDEIDAAFIQQEKDILNQQALNEGKDAKVVEKMVIGRLNKRLKEVCLLDQEYIKDNELTVGKYFDSVAKESGANAKILRFVVFEKGEGIEKKEENFADEVSKAING